MGGTPAGDTPPQPSLQRPLAGRASPGAVPAESEAAGIAAVRRREAVATALISLLPRLLPPPLAPAGQGSLGRLLTGGRRRGSGHSSALCPQLCVLLPMARWCFDNAKCQALLAVWLSLPAVRLPPGTRSTSSRAAGLGLVPSAWSSGAVPAQRAFGLVCWQLTLCLWY